MILPALAALLGLGAADGTASNRGATVSLEELVEPGRGHPSWGAIVIHQSGEPEGSAESLETYYRKVLRAPGGIDHHFVIGNGRGAPDGSIAATAAWRNGARTTHLFRRGDLPPALSICLIGNLDQAAPTENQIASLADLVAGLSRRFGIPVSNVLNHREVEGIRSHCPGSRLSKLEVLERAGMVPEGERRLVLDPEAGEASLRIGDAVLRTFWMPAKRVSATSAGNAAKKITGSYSVCRQDPGGAFGPTLVLAWPDLEQVKHAQTDGRITAEEAARLREALESGRCPPGDTALGGELAIHAPIAAEADEPGTCLIVDPADVESLLRSAPVGSRVEIRP